PYTTLFRSARGEARRLLRGAGEHAGATAEGRGRLEREHRPERAVVAPAGGDRVDVGARRGDRPVTGRQCPEVAVRVERRLEPGLGRPAGDEAHRGRLG